MLRRALPLLCVLLLTAPALAAGWNATTQEDEGGPVLTASVTGTAPGPFPPMLSLTCGDRVALRYHLAGDRGRAGKAVAFRFSSESDEASVPMSYEEMDGAFAAYLPRTAPLLNLLKSGTDLLVTDPTRTYPPQTFTLSGSSKAIEALLASCE